MFPKGSEELILEQDNVSRIRCVSDIELNIHKFLVL